MSLGEIGFRCPRAASSGVYDVVVTYQGREMRLTWFHSWARPRPDLRGVLTVLALDNALVQMPYEAWREHDKLPDDAASREMYTRQQELWRQMVALFGDDYPLLRRHYADA
jgi:hypothetical protein